MTDEQFNQLKKSIEKFGYINYLTVDEQYRVIGGNHRLKAMKELGFEKIKVIQVKGFSESEIKSMNVALNQIHGEINEIKMESFMIDMEEEDIEFLDDSNSEIKEEEIKEEEIKIKPYNKTHILISFEPEKLLIIEKYLKEIINIGVEIEQSSN